MVDKLIAVDDIDFLLPIPVLEALKPTINEAAALFLASNPAVINAATEAAQTAVEDKGLVSAYVSPLDPRILILSYVDKFVNNTVPTTVTEKV